MYELFEDAPKVGKTPTVWAFPQFVDFLKVSSQPVQGPWPPHQEPRPDPEAESMPVAVPDPASAADRGPDKGMDQEVAEKPEPLQLGPDSRRFDEDGSLADDAPHGKGRHTASGPS